MRERRANRGLIGPMEVMPPSLALKLVIGTASLSLIIFAVLAQLPTVSTQQVYNWQYPADDVHNTNHSPQNLITRENVGRLALAWLYQIPENPFRIPSLAPLQGIETTPLIVDGIVYFATPYNRVIALRADTGTLVWSYQVNMSEFVRKPYWAYVANQKSIWYYNNSILMMASDCSIHVLDALSGRLLRHVPGEVVCDIPGNTGYYWGEQAPIVYGDLLIVRASTAGFGGRGFLAAYNLRDMKLVWRWYTVPPVGGDPEWSAKYTVERDGRLFGGEDAGQHQTVPWRLGHDRPYRRGSVMGPNSHRPRRGNDLRLCRTTLPLLRCLAPSRPKPVHRVHRRHRRQDRGHEMVLSGHAPRPRPLRTWVERHIGRAGHRRD
jgi:uncharacterized protein (UPF0248 family)